MPSKGFFLIILLLSFVAADAQERSLTVTAGPEPGTKLVFAQECPVTINLTLNYSGLFAKNVFIAQTLLGEPGKTPEDPTIYPGTHFEAVVAEVEGNSGTATGALSISLNIATVKDFLAQLETPPADLLLVINFVASDAEKVTSMEFFPDNLVYPVLLSDDTDCSTSISSLGWGQVKTQY